MPNNGEEQPAITFSEYPGGPVIGFAERNIEALEQGFPIWSMQQQAVVPPYALVGPGKRFLAISHVLASAYRQDMYLHGLDPMRYDLAYVKALMSATKPEMSDPQAVARSSEDSVNRGSDKEIRRLQERIHFLQSQLQSQKPHLRLYRFGAGSLFVAVISLVVWLLTGTGIPFHPIFAAGVIPASLGVIVMGFLIRPGLRGSRNQ
jgi:hypothetical protein